MTLFIYTADSTFVKNDEIILSRFSKIKKHRYQQGKSLLRHLKSQWGMTIWLLKNIGSANVIYCWFADYHSFLPALLAKIFRKKFYIVLGGYDVTNIPELNYGSHKNALRSYCSKFTIRHATCNLAVSNYVRKMALELVPTANVATIYNGIDTELTRHNTTGQKNKRLILTVGSADNLQRIRLKGIDFYCSVAREMPDYRFIIIGIGENAKKHLMPVPKNVDIFEKLEFNELIKFYQTAKVYCQFSLVESFGMTIAEAMFYKCVPVGTAAGAIPELIGNTGYLVTGPTIKEAVEAIKKAATASDEAGRKAFERIEKKFNLSQRENALKELFN